MKDDRRGCSAHSVLSDKLTKDRLAFLRSALTRMQGGRGPWPHPSVHAERRRTC